MKSEIPVSTSHDLRVGALLLGHGEHLGGLRNGLGVRVLGQEVGKQAGSVVSANALAGDLVFAQLLFQGSAGRASDDQSLFSSCKFLIDQIITALHWR